jgi:uncharacterized membrane protein HdeD (DUF308 family)
MRYELKSHRLTFGILAFMLTGFVVFLLRLRPSLADERLEVIASLAIVILASAMFTIMGIFEGTIAFQFGNKHKRELLSYLLLGLVSLASGLYLAFSEEASLQVIALVAAPHAPLFGLGEVRIAQHLEHHPAYRRGLVINGVVEIVLGIVLILGSGFSNEGTATLLGFVAILSILQLLPVLFYSHKVAPQRAGSATIKVPEQSAAITHSPA